MAQAFQVASGNTRQKCREAVKAVRRQAENMGLIVEHAEQPKRHDNGLYAGKWAAGMVLHS